MKPEKHINEGGPAYPVPAEQYVSDGVSISIQAYHGMSLRDWFAGQALAGMMVSDSPHIETKQYALACYEMADAMIEARKGGSQ
jgi:hypothetical protein